MFPIMAWMRYSIFIVTTQFYVRAARISFHFTASINATRNECSPTHTDWECEILANATEEPKPYYRMQDAQSTVNWLMVPIDGTATFACVDKPKRKSYNNMFRVPNDAMTYKNLNGPSRSVHFTLLYHNKSPVRNFRRPVPNRIHLVFYYLNKMTQCMQMNGPKGHKMCRRRIRRGRWI